MIQTALEEFPKKSSLNPVLQAALSSLDVQLEAELARYRRRQPQPSRAKQAFQEHYRSKVLNAHPEDVTTAQLAIAPETQGEVTEETKLSAETGLKSEQPSSDREVISANEDSSLVHQVQPAEEKVEPEETINEHPPEDYLASSEQLLNTLAEEEPAKEKKTNPLASLFTPLGVSSMLVFLVASSLLAWALMPEEAWSKLGLSGIVSAESETTAPQSLEIKPVVPESPEKTTIPPGPNLATEEFVELNLSTLSNVKPSPTPQTNIDSSNLPTASETPGSQQGSPGPVVIKRSSDLATALLPPSLQPAPVPPANSAPATTPTNPFPTAQPSPSNSQNNQNYVVLIDYSGESSLVKARAIAPDAFVRKTASGDKIQMATFTNQADAQRYVQNLKQQGISASVASVAG
ncbi:MAG: SPOR domain-containing protein [Oscillatoria sp. PMC 1051.18]|nr:SPOR domain-containing protein [Oscillatoria sp. PMC 1050.18]MEC5032047.1 SPOR domain-containing protein [Oscillatoria sp. PMC 1051.18]